MVKNEIIIGKRYEVLSKIGSGGMADVYKGRDTMLNRYVAIKVLKKEYREDADFVRKFISEAQAAAGLMHPNIVNVYDVGADRGLYYMVMELVDGITLKDHIDKKGRLPYREVISVAIQMCNGIGAAHEAGLVHRDIKPQNIMISKDGKVKVTDFGIAKAISSNTISSNAMGSVHYTSPEQARGGYSDEKSDIYSIGITLFEMATGRVPFDGDSVTAVAIKHLQEEITPPSEFVPDIPYSLEQIILKCTQKNGERRYASTQLLIRDLKHSLMDPDGDFVVIPPMNNADTMIISGEDLDKIQKSGRKKKYEDDYDDYASDDYDDDDYDDYDDRRRKRRSYDEDDYDDYDEDDDDELDEVNPGMNRVMKILMIVVAVIILFIGVYAVGRAIGIFSVGPGVATEDEDEDTVKVPDVVGLTEDEAQDLLNEKGLGMRVVSREESDKYDEGTVCEQDVEAGEKVAKNTQIKVVVSSGLVGEEIEVPDVTDEEEDAAQKELTKAGFTKVTSSYEYSDTVDEGCVISTTPAAKSKATADTEIKMIVSKGAQKIEVPAVTGKKDADAQAAIKSAGLTVGTVTYDYSDSVESGKVISQSVSAGKKVAAGTSVSIVVSNGPKEKKVSVSSFVGKDEEDLLYWAQQNGLNAKCTGYDNSNVYADGKIISQSPTSGTVNQGSTISYTLSIGPEQNTED